MSRNRFVTADTDRLSLSDGDWVEVKRSLSHGEERRLQSSMLRAVSSEKGDNTVEIDWAKHSLLRLETYLTDWSFRGEDDKPVPLSRKAIENLDGATGQEIEAALEAHILAHAPKVTENGTPPAS